MCVCVFLFGSDVTGSLKLNQKHCEFIIFVHPEEDEWEEATVLEHCILKPA